MPDAYLLAGARTPIGKFLGAFQDMPAPELAAVTIQESLSRCGVNPAEVDEVIMGNVLSAGLGQAPARQAALKAGLPSSVAALTINKVCGSGLKAVMLAAQAIRLEEAKVIVAGGMENMSRTPHLALNSRHGWKLGDAQLKDAMVHDGLWCAFENRHMGLHAEYVSETFDLTRDDLDRYAVESQQRAGSASEQGLFADEIVPVIVKQRRSEVTIDTDEGPRPGTTLESLLQLKPAFSAEGIVTAGNASMLSDGAASVVVADEETAYDSAVPWKARIVACHTSGTDPKDLFIAPVSAINGVLEKAGLTTDQIDLFEINEAFAAQMVACLRALDLDPEKVNVNGGAIALGHPIGASGCRILVTLLSALKQRNLKRGVASLCLGGGNAVAMVVERVDL